MNLVTNVISFAAARARVLRAEITLQALDESIGRPTNGPVLPYLQRKRERAAAELDAANEAFRKWEAS